MKKDLKPDTLAVIDIQTDGHGNSMTDPAQRAESVKIEGTARYARQLPAPSDVIGLVQ